MVLLVPFTPESKGLADSGFLARMKDGALPSGRDLWSLPGVFITPHVAASTPVSRQRAARLVREQAEAYPRGEPLRNVISGSY